MNRLQKAALALVLASFGGLAAHGVLAGEITVSLYSAFTTLDPYNASDTLSQNVAKSFYEGLFSFDKNM